MGTNVGRRSNRSVRSHRKVKHPVDPQATYPTFSIGQDVPTPTIITAPVSPYGVYAKYIGRVGALAVALGVGVAVATGFGIGIAKADDGGAAGNAPATDTAADPSTPTPADQGTPDDQVTAPTASGGLSDGAASDTDTDNPADTGMNVDSSGGQDTSGNDAGQSTDTTAGDVDEGEYVVDDVDADDDEDATTPTPAAPPAVDYDSPAATNASATKKPQPSSSPAKSSPTPNPDAKPSATRVAEGSDTVGAQEFSTVSTRVPEPEVVVAAAALPAPEPAANAPLVTTFVSTVLSPLLTPGPGAPVDPPLVLGLLAWVRKEEQRRYVDEAAVAGQQQAATELVVPGAAEAMASDAPMMASFSLAAAATVPTAANNSATTKEDTAVTISVLANDSDPEGDPLSPVVVTDPANGIVTANGDGTLTYRPNQNFNGTDTFTYSASDGVSESAPATVTVKVTAVNDAPVANPDHASTTEDTPVVINVKANDTDVENNNLTPQVVTNPVNGKVVRNADGTFTYTPKANFSGTDSFTYRVTDGATSNTTSVTIEVAAVNDAPTAANNSATTKEDTAVTINVLANDSDPEGDPLSPVVVTDPANGIVTANGDGTLTYRPNENFNGTDTFTYSASDGVSESAPATVTVKVTAVNDAPVANPDHASTTEDTPVVINVKANDTDVENNNLTPQVVTNPVNGKVVRNADGTFTYTPKANFSGTDSFTYRVTDGATSNTTSVTIEVAAVNDAPTAANNSATTKEDTAVTINVLANDSDPEGDPLSPVVVTDPANGIVTANGDGTLTYRPNENFNGTDTFTYSASDGVSESAPATVTVKVTAVNDAPVANPDTATTDANTPVVINVKANDTDVENNNLTPQVVTNPVNGKVVRNADGTFTYTPKANFSGPDSFTYRVTDGATSNTTTVTIAVRSPNVAPVANADSYTVEEGGTLTVPAALGLLGNDTDADGDALTPIRISQPTHGALTFNDDGSFTYAPNAGFTGTDSFEYTVSDGELLAGSPTTVSITVTELDNTPPAVTASSSIADTATGAVTVTVVVRDPDDDPLTLTIISPAGAAGATGAVGAVSLPTYDPVADTYTYTATYTPSQAARLHAGLDGPQTDTITIAVNDGHGVPVTTTTTVAVSPAQFVVVDTDRATPGIAPITTGDIPVGAAFSPNGSFAYVINYGSNSVSVIDTATHTLIDTDSTAPGINGITVPNGPEEVAFSPDGSLAYVTHSGGDSVSVIDTATHTLIDTNPTAPGINGINVGHSTRGVAFSPDGSFAYVTGGNNKLSVINTATHTLVDTDPATPGITPITVGTGAHGVAFSPDGSIAYVSNTGHNTVSVINAATHTLIDTDPGTPGITPITVGGSPQGVAFSPDGNFAYVVTQPPNNGDNGFVSVINTATHTLVDTNPAGPGINGIPVGDGPNRVTFSPDGSLAYVTGEVGGTVSVIDTAAYTVIDTNPATPGISPISVGGFVAQVAVSPDGSLGYVTTYSNGTVSVFSLVARGNTPVAHDDALSTDEDTALTINPAQLVANDDGDSLTVTVVGSPTHGTLSANPAGSFTYTPEADYNGSDSFTYKAIDGAVDSNTATVHLTINPVNDRPIANPDTYSTAEDTELVVPASAGILANDTDIDSTTQNITVLTGVSHGRLRVATDGSLTYTPDANFNGSDSFTYAVNDGAAGGTSNSNIATVTFTVTPVNDAPVAVDDSASTNEDTPLTIPAPGLLANDSDAGGSALTAALVTPPAHGTATVNPDGSITYTPAPDYNGSDSFTYKANDGDLDSNTATVHLTINPVNDRPIANPDTYSTAEDTELVVPASAGILANDTDIDSTTQNITVLTGVSHGRLRVATDGSLTYTPDANFNGSDSFTYAVNDGAAGGTSNSNIATVTFTVTPVNDAPVAVADAFTTNEDTPLSITSAQLLANDFHPEGDPLTVVAGTFATNGGGTVVISPDGPITYTPDDNESGADSFTYTIRDGRGGEAVGTVTINVTAVDDGPPVANNDAAVANEGASTAVDVLGNDTDADGNSTINPSSVTVTQNPANGSITVNTNGTITYTSNGAEVTSDSFTYTVKDTTGATSNAATVTVTITPINDAPTAVNNTFTATEDNVRVFSTADLVGNDTDPDVGDTLSLNSVSQAVNGTIVFNADGTVYYTPNTNYFGADSFTYTVKDAAGAISNTATVTLNVANANDKPVAFPTPGDPEPVNGVVTGNVNATDPDGNTLTYSVPPTTPKGSVSIDSTGTFTYTPTAAARHAAAATTATDADKYDTFTVTVRDNVGAPLTVNVTVSVLKKNAVPTNGTYTPQPANQNPNQTTGAVSGTVTATDADNDTLTYSGSNVTFKGTAVVNPNGTFTYTPTAAAMHNASATTATADDKKDTFTVTVTDAHGGTIAIPATINILAKNAAPTATTVVGDFSNTVQSGSVTATDPDGDALTYAQTVVATKGSASINLTTGEWSYVPTQAARDVAAQTAGADFDTFTYTVNDGHGQALSRTVTVEVMPTGVISEIRSATSGYLSPDGTRAVAARTIFDASAANYKTTYTLTRTTSGQVMGQYTYDGQADPVEFTSDSKLAVLRTWTSTPSRETTVAVLDLTSGTAQGGGVLPDIFTDVMFSPDNKTVFVSGELTDANNNVTATRVAMITGTNTRQFIVFGELNGTPLISPDGTRVLAASTPVTLGRTEMTVINAATGARLGGVAINGTALKEMQITRNGTAIGTFKPASGSGATTIAVLNMADGSLIGFPRIYQGDALPMTFSPNGVTAAITIDDQTISTSPVTRIVLINTVTGTMFGPIETAGNASGAAVFNADGTKIFRVTNDEVATTRIAVFDVNSLSVVGTPTVMSGWSRGGLVMSPTLGYAALVVDTFEQSTGGPTRVVVFSGVTGLQSNAAVRITGQANRSDVPVWSPDGLRFVVFTQQFFPTANPDIDTVHGRISVFDFGGFLVSSSEVWSEQQVPAWNKEVQFATNDRAILTYAADLDGTGQTARGRIVVFNTTNGVVLQNVSFLLEGGDSIDLKFSANGAAAIDDSISTYNGTEQAFFINTATGSGSSVSAANTYTIHRSELTPDGSRAITTQYKYDSTTQIYTTQIYVTNLATTVTTLTTVQGKDIATARWSPDGLRVSIETTTGMRTLAL